MAIGMDSANTEATLISRGKLILEFMMDFD